MGKPNQVCSCIHVLYMYVLVLMHVSMVLQCSYEIFTIKAHECSLAVAASYSIDVIVVLKILDCSDNIHIQKHKYL